MQRLTQTKTTQSSSSSLYDQETARQVLARATDLYQESDRLSADQVEALGRELGIDSSVVCRAIEERERILGKAQTQRARTTHLPITIRQVWGACGPIWYLALAVTCLILSMRSVFPHAVPVGFEVAVEILTWGCPAAFAFWIGRRVRDWRLGMIAGSAGTILLYLAFYITFCAATHTWVTAPPEIFVVILGMVALSGMVAAVGAAISRQPNQKHTVQSARATNC